MNNSWNILNYLPITLNSPNKAQECLPILTTSSFGSVFNTKLPIAIPPSFTTSLDIQVSIIHIAIFDIYSSHFLPCNLLLLLSPG